jgi:hypothetical protein
MILLLVVSLKAKGYPIERLLQVRPSESATHSVETPKDVFDSNTSLDNSFSRQVKLVEKLKKKFSKVIFFLTGTHVHVR